MPTMMWQPPGFAATTRRAGSPRKASGGVAGDGSGFRSDQMVNRGDMRASDADHDVAAARLRGHYAAGRLTQEGFRRRGRRRLRFRSRLLLTLATVTAIWLLIGFSLPHNGLLIAALLLMLGLLGLTAGVVVALVWLARRAWRRGAWLEGLPVLVGLPWLGRAV